MHGPDSIGKDFLGKSSNVVEVPKKDGSIVRKTSQFKHRDRPQLAQILGE